MWRLHNIAKPYFSAPWLTANCRVRQAVDSCLRDPFVVLIEVCIVCARGSDAYLLQLMIDMLVKLVERCFMRYVVA